MAAFCSEKVTTGLLLLAAFVVHGNDPFQRKELAFCYGFAALALLLAGPGRFSADARLLARK